MSNPPPVKKKTTKKRIESDLWDEVPVYLSALHSKYCATPSSDVFTDVGRWETTRYHWWDDRKQKFISKGPVFASYREALLYCCKANSNLFGAEEWKANSKVWKIEPFDGVYMIEASTDELEKYLVMMKKVTNIQSEGELILCNAAVPTPMPEDRLMEFLLKT